MRDTARPNLLALLRGEYRRVAGTDGGEYAGPCPFPDCDADDDGFHVWPHAARPRYWCRRCTRHGDTIQLLRDVHGCSYTEAVRVVGRAAAALSPPRTRHS